MKLTGLGKLSVFILAVGVAMGGWRWWQEQQGNKGGFKMPGVKLPGFGQQTGGDKGSTAPGKSNEIQFVITAAKRDWVGDQVERFNAAHGGKWRIVTTPVPS